MEIYSFLSETIHAYTGLSLAAFFTILSLMIGAYFLVSSFFVHPDSVAVTEKSAVATTTPSAEQPPSPPPALLAQPVQMGEMTLEELKVYNGSDRNKPLLVSIKGDVYNVSRGCSISDITVDHGTTELPIEICNASPVSAAELGSLMRRLSTAIQYSRSVVEKGGYYGDKEQEMDKFENGVKVDLKAMSLRKLKAMYKKKLIHLSSSNSVLN
ncbi:uncharacterized protein LOC144555869 isoform X1 [Carex rostrata]